MCLFLIAAGRVIVSGGSDGLIAISSPATGMTVRMLNDHKGASITDIHVSLHRVSLRFSMCAVVTPLPTYFKYPCSNIWLYVRNM